MSIDFSTAKPAPVLTPEFDTEAYQVLTPPLVMALPCHDASGLLDLQWQGGSPPFRPHHCDDLVNRAWQAEALTFSTNVTMTPSPQHEFFRVLYLGQ